MEPDGGISTHSVAAIGFYGESLTVGFGSRGDWDSFGLDRLVTKSKGYILFEIDGQPALDLYKSFLGDKAKDLPASGLLLLSVHLAYTEYQDDLTRVELILEQSSGELFKANRELSRIAQEKTEEAALTSQRL